MEHSFETTTNDYPCVQNSQRLRCYAFEKKFFFDAFACIASVFLVTSNQFIESVTKQFRQNIEAWKQV